MVREMQKIKCNVYDCEYCNIDKSLCRLDSIRVTNCLEEANQKEATMCDSYEKR